LADLGDFDVRVGGLLLLLGSGLPALASDVPPLRVSTLLGETRRPVTLFETDELIAIASEEVSINRIFPGQALNTTEPLPGSYKTWSRASI